MDQQVTSWYFYLFQVPANSTVTMDAFLKGPSLFWWISEHYVDLTLDLVAYLGISLSAILLFLGSGNVLIFVVLRVLYHSLVFVGQIWYAFGESSNQIVALIHVTLEAIVRLIFIISIEIPNLKR